MNDWREKLSYIAAVDQGTTSTRCILFNHQAQIISSYQIEHEQIYPSAGWVEHDPQEILQNALKCILNAVNAAGCSLAEISALGITNQRETTLLWNKKTGLPYHNAVVWQDTRTDKICEKLQKEGLQDLFVKKSGLPIATYFSGPKIKWLMDHNPLIKKDISKDEVLFGNIDSWLIWNLTGGNSGGKHITDVTNASRTMLMNLENLQWDEDLCGILGIPLEILPNILPSSHIYGQWHYGNASIDVCGDLGDQQAALFGQVCFEKGDAKNTYGTGCFMLLNTGETIVKSKHGLLTTVGYQIGSSDPVYCLEGSIAVTGALVQWMRDNLGIIDKSHDIEKLALTVNDNGGVYFVPAFSGLFAPYWRSDARGLIIGLTQFANKGHIARAALEATAFQTREVLEAMIKDSGVSLSQLKVDGGMVVNEFLMQFQADILNVPVIRPTITETTALGAAYAAGLAKGYWKGMDELRENWEENRKWSPVMDETQREERLLCWKKAVSRSLGWVENA